MGKLPAMTYPLSKVLRYSIELLPLLASMRLFYSISSCSTSHDFLIIPYALRNYSQEYSRMTRFLMILGTKEFSHSS